MIFQKWLITARNISKSLDSLSVFECPHCGKKCLDYIYIGDEKTRTGYLQVWCNDCLNGIYISRVTIPQGAKMLTFDTTEDLNKIIPLYHKVTPEE